MTLDEVKLRYVRYTLYMNNGHRQNTADQLAISIRTVRNYIKEMKRQGLVENDHREIVKDTQAFLDFLYKMPSNDERLKHLDNPKKLRYN